MVRYRISDLIVADSLVAEFQESMQSAIPQMNAVLNIQDKKIHQPGAHKLPQTSGQGKIFTFLIK